jgi:hypothetical protein
MDPNGESSDDFRVDRSWFSVGRLTDPDGSPGYLLSRPVDEGLSFDAAVAQLQDFLEHNGYPSKVVWVEPTDIVLAGQRSIYVKVPVSPANLVRACDRFTRGISSKLGICFETICEMSDSTFCYAWSPADNREQQEHLMDPTLKLSAKTGHSRVPGIPVAGGMSWLLLRLRHRRFLRQRELLFY